MKVSKKTKQKTKIKLIESAVEVIIEKGYKSASMREIAKRAGVSDPTIYNYFPTKEQILYAYIELKHTEALKMLKEIEDFETYSLREQLQSLIEAELELYLADREFIQEIFDLAFYSSSVKLEELYHTKELFTDMIKEMFALSIEAGEIEPQPFEEFVPLLFWDYFIAVVAYWLKDDSQSFSNTTRFVDYSMEIIESVIKANLLSKISDFGLFLFKTHILSKISKFGMKPSKFDSVKRRFMEVLDE